MQSLCHSRQKCMRISQYYVLEGFDQFLSTSLWEVTCSSCSSRSSRGMGKVARKGEYEEGKDNLGGTCDGLPCIVMAGGRSKPARTVLCKMDCEEDRASFQQPTRKEVLTTLKVKRFTPYFHLKRFYSQPPCRL